MPSQPTRNQLQSAAPMPSKQLHSDLPAGGSEPAKHHCTEGRKRHLASRLHCPTLPSEPTRNQLHSAAPMPSAPQRSLSGRFRNSNTPWHACPPCLPVCLSACPRVCLPVCLSACLPVCPSACLPVCLSACLPVCLSACLPVCLSVCVSVSLCLSVCLHLASRLHYLTLPSEPTRNQLQSAAPMPSKQRHSDLPAGGSETAKHHGTEGRKRRLASRVHCLTLPSEPTRNQLQSAAPMPSKQLLKDGSGP